MKPMRYLIVLLALAGAVVSVLALRVHYSTGTEPCSINERWDCGIVNHSSFSQIEHVPVAAIGIVGYLVLAGLAFARQRFLLFLATLVGLGFALRLTFIEEYVLHGLVSLLRHLAGHHRAHRAAQPGLANGGIYRPEAGALCRAGIPERLKKI